MERDRSRPRTNKYQGVVELYSPYIPEDVVEDRILYVSAIRLDALESGVGWQDPKPKTESSYEHRPDDIVLSLIMTRFLSFSGWCLDWIGSDLNDSCCLVALRVPYAVLCCTVLYRMHTYIHA